MVFCWRRVVLILFMFFLFAASLFISRGMEVYHLVFDKTSFSHPDSVTEEAFLDVVQEVFLERLAVSFPDVIENLSTMNLQQKKALIDMARKDAVAAASANGQDCERARKFGEAVATAVSKAIFHPSIVNTYF
ncbi:hypothetical protein V3565_05445 [Bartonella sp. B10]